MVNDLIGHSPKLLNLAEGRFLRGESEGGRPVLWLDPTSRKLRESCPKFETFFEKYFTARASLGIVNMKFCARAFLAEMSKTLHKPLKRKKIIVTNFE